MTWSLVRGVEHQQLVRRVRTPLLLTAFLTGCAKPAPPVSPADGYGYEQVDDPLADSEKADAQLPTSCARLRCPSPRCAESCHSATRGPPRTHIALVKKTTFAGSILGFAG